MSTGYAATNSYGSGYGTAVKGSISNAIYLEPYYTTSPGSINPRATGVFNGQALAGGHRSVAIERPTERVDDAPQ